MKAGKQSTKLTKCTKKVYFCRFTSFPTSRWERKVMDTRFIKRLISRIGFSSQAVPTFPIRDWERDLKHTKCTKKVYFCRFTSFPTSRWERKVMDTRFIKRLISRIGFSSQAVPYVPNQRLGTRFKAHEVHEESVFLQIYLVHYVPLGAR